MVHRLTWVALAGVLALLSASSLRGANWPQWRGPNFNGATDETNLPRRLSKQEQVLWKTPLPGRSGATPVVWGDAIFLPSPGAGSPGAGSGGRVRGPGQARGRVRP